MTLQPLSPVPSSSGHRREEGKQERRKRKLEEKETSDYGELRECNKTLIMICKKEKEKREN